MTGSPGLRRERAGPQSPVGLWLCPGGHGRVLHRVLVQPGGPARETVAAPGAAGSQEAECAPHTHTPGLCPHCIHLGRAALTPPPSVARERVHSTAHEPREGKQGAAGEWWKAAGVGERERAPRHRPVPGPAPPCARPAPRAMPSLPRRTLAHTHADHSHMHQHSLPTPATDTLVRGHAHATHRMMCTRPTVPPAPRWATRAWPGFPGGVPVPSRASGVLLLVALSPSPTFSVDPPLPQPSSTERSWQPVVSGCPGWGLRGLGSPRHWAARPPCLPLGRVSPATAQRAPGGVGSWETWVPGHTPAQVRPSCSHLSICCPELAVPTTRPAGMTLGPRPQGLATARPLPDRLPHVTLGM